MSQQVAWSASSVHPCDSVPAHLMLAAFSLRTCVVAVQSSVLQVALGSQQVSWSPVPQVAPAQSSSALPGALTSVAVGQSYVEHFARASQQFALSAASAHVLVAQGVFASLAFAAKPSVHERSLHVCFASQHVSLSEPAVVAAAAMATCVALGQVWAEHAATQHVALFVSLSTHVASAQTALPLTTVSAPQSNLAEFGSAVDTSYEALHVAFASQHVPLSLAAQVAPAHGRAAASALATCVAAGQVSESHLAFASQQVASSSAVTHAVPAQTRDVSDLATCVAAVQVSVEQAAFASQQVAQSYTSHTVPTQ
jgi:hypothetical protein